MADEFTKAALYWIKTFNKKVKEKIWIEKLIELLNEYWEYDLVEHNWEICKWTTDDETGEMNIYTDYTNNIISKKFWFIKWLVENDKIDRDEIIISSDFMPVAFDRKWEKYEWSEEKQLLMLLSISDTPIEFLISLLKNV